MITSKIADFGDGFYWSYTINGILKSKKEGFNHQIYIGNEASTTRSLSIKSMNFTKKGWELLSSEDWGF